MPKVIIKCSEDGPNLSVVDDKVTAALCRCGGLQNKPYIDGTHEESSFTAKLTELNILQ